MKTYEKRLIKDYSLPTEEISLYQLIGSNRIFKNKVARRNTKQPKQSGHCSPCLSRMDNLCCKQVKQTITFQSYGTKETFQIFHNLTCKSENLIHLLQCRICQLQYVGKSKTPFNIRLNNHRKDAKYEPQFWRVNISTNKTIIFKNMLNPL